MSVSTQQAPRILRLPEVMVLARRSRSSILRDVKAERFPKPIKLGPWSIGFVATEVEAWLADRIADRDQGAAA